MHEPQYTFLSYKFCFSKLMHNISPEWCFILPHLQEVGSDPAGHQHELPEEGRLAAEPPSTQCFRPGPALKCPACLDSSKLYWPWSIKLHLQHIGMRRGLLHHSRQISLVLSRGVRNTPWCAVQVANGYEIDWHFCSLSQLTACSALMSTFRSACGFTELSKPHSVTLRRVSQVCVGCDGPELQPAGAPLAALGRAGHLTLPQGCSVQPQTASTPSHAYSPPL